MTHEAHPSNQGNIPAGMEPTSVFNEAVKRVHEALAGRIDDDFEMFRRPAERLAEQATRLIQSGSADVVHDVLGIVEDNALAGSKITPVMGTYGGDARLEKCARLLVIYERDPSAAKAIAANNVAGFHVMSSGSLPGVLKHGSLLTELELRTRREEIMLGERLYSPQGGRATVSFSDWRQPGSILMYTNIPEDQTINDLRAQLNNMFEGYQAAESQWGPSHPWARNGKVIAHDLERQIDFITNNPDSEDAQLILSSFPIAFGLNIAGYNIEERLHLRKETQVQPNTIDAVPRSQIPGEFMVFDSDIPLSRLPVVAVPEDQILRVQELFRRRNYSPVIINLALIST